MIASLVMWGVTRSPFALAFAALGPVVALATVADGRLHGRTAARRERARFAREWEATRSAIRVHNESERRQRLESLPGIPARLAGGHTGWMEAPPELIRVGLGRGESLATVSSATVLVDGPEAERLRALQDEAETLDGVPRSVNAAGGISVTGSRVESIAVARALVLQLAFDLSPSSYGIEGPGGEDWNWLNELPHARLSPAGDGTVRFLSQDRASYAIGFPTRDLQGSVGLATALKPADDPFLDQVSEELAILVARDLCARATRDGLGRQPDALPDVVDLRDLGPVEHGDVGGLGAVIGVSRDGRCALDLVRDGPHAVVGGTTGSGKSELLLSWVLAIAGERSPDHVTFLFVDFKGGASFGPVASIPHCVGVITDLDEDESLRALSSLRAELRFRERRLAEVGLRSIDDASYLPPFPRLVVMVDEYAALVETYDALHSVFLDIAARGRSLGVHLVLCTQRPTGVIRDGILANCALRISLRVNNAADSTAVIGSGAAAALPASVRGRALVSAGGADPVSVQVGRSTGDDVALVLRRWSDSNPPRRPWCPPLAGRIPLPGINSGPLTEQIPLCMVDLPDRQAQEPAAYDPQRDGSMLVVGGARSGKSGLVRTLASAPTTLHRIVVAGGFSALWDALDAVLVDGDIPATTPGARVSRVLIVDDCDAIVASAPDEYRDQLVDRLTRAVREGASRGLSVVLTAQRITGGLQSISALCGSTIVLRMPNRQEHVLAGADAALFSTGVPPGAGLWNGRRIQVYESVHGVIPAGPEGVEVIPRFPFAVVSSQPLLFAEECARRGISCVPLSTVVPVFSAIEVPAEVLVGDAEEWQAHYALFTAVRRDREVVFDGCSLVDFRALARIRELPPPPTGSRHRWIMSPDGRMDRMRLAAAA